MLTGNGPDDRSIKDRKFRRAIAAFAIWGLVGMNATGEELSRTMQTFSPRLAEPRVPPVANDARTPDQEKMLAGRPDYNIYKTLAHDTQLYERWSALGQYLLNGSTLPARDREIIILRMGWLCQAPYEWSQHARIAKASVNMTGEEVHRIAVGRDAKGWGDFDRTLISMVDELRYEAQISDATWLKLRAKYSVEQTIDAIYTAGQYQLVSMALNSLGVQLDPVLPDRIPADVKMPALASMPARPLPSPRVKPLTWDAMTAEQRELVAPQMREHMVPNLYATLVVHPRLYAPRLRFGSYLQRESRLQPKTRELLILRTAWLMNSEYEWAHHVPVARDAGFTEAEIARIAQRPLANEWSDEHRLLLTAVDDLRREAFISDATWQQLAKRYDTETLIEIVYTVGGYAMTAFAINSLGIQVEDQYSRTRFTSALRR
jgi:4-carboxymuconolactone decarboxylase